MSGLRSDYDEQRSPSFRFVTEKQLEDIHLATLEIMSRTGCRIYEEEAVSLLRKAGADVSDGNLVRIPASLVEWAIRAVPPRFVLCDRNGNRVMPMETTKVYFGPGSDLLNIIDPRTGERRKSTMQDVFDSLKLVQALENIDFVMSMFMPWDVRTEISDRYQMEAMLLYCSKPIVFVTHDLSGCVDAVQMAAEVAGGMNELQRNPTVACYCNVTTSLRHNKEAVQKLLYMAEHGLPVLYIPSVMRGVSVPMTTAGAIALANACQLTGLVLTQLKREGTPVVRAGSGNSIDMRTMVMTYAAPEVSRARVVATELAHRYHQSIFGTGGCTESKVFDQQAAVEAAQTLILSALSGSNLIHDIGYMESGLTGSLELLALCDDVIGWLKHLMAGIEVNEETLALDLINEVGPDGNYLATEHTLHHFREEFQPRFIDRHNYDDWLAQGGMVLGDKLKQKVLAIIEGPQELVVSEAVAAKVRAIRQRAEETAHVGT